MSELPLYLLLGVFCGLVSITLSRCTSLTMEAVERLQRATGLPKAASPALGGLIVGLLALMYPEVLYWGFENVDILLESRPFTSGLSATILVQLIGVKILATSLCRAFGLVGGYYAPSLFIGAATGMAYGKFMRFTFTGPEPLLHIPFLDVASPQAYGLVTCLPIQLSHLHSAFFFFFSTILITISLQCYVIIFCIPNVKLVFHSLYLG